MHGRYFFPDIHSVDVREFTGWNFVNLEKAGALYERLGYRPMEVPWKVSRQAWRSTAPLNVKPVEIPNSDEVKIGSGEQGFIELLLRGWKPKHRFYQTTTLCWRDEPTDQFHQKLFLKLELFAPVSNLTFSQQYARFDKVNHDALIVLKNILPELSLSWEDTSTLPKYGPVQISRDIIARLDKDYQAESVELGSYGIRHYLGHSWVYGTGIAEPRSTLAAIEEVSRNYWR